MKGAAERLRHVARWDVRRKPERRGGRGRKEGRNSIPDLVPTRNAGFPYQSHAKATCGHEAYIQTTGVEQTLYDYLSTSVKDRPAIGM